MTISDKITQPAHPDFALGDKIKSKLRPYEPAATVIGYDGARKLVYYTMPNGSNPDISGFGPQHLFRKES